MRRGGHRFRQATILLGHANAHRDFENFLGEFRRLACGYEAVQHEGTPMGSEQHGVTVVGEYRGCMK